MSEKDHALVKGISWETNWLMRAPDKNMTTSSDVAVTADRSSGSNRVAVYRPNITFVEVPVKMRQQSTDIFIMQQQ